MGIAIRWDITTLPNGQAKLRYECVEAIEAEMDMDMALMLAGLPKDGKYNHPVTIYKDGKLVWEYKSPDVTRHTKEQEHPLGTKTIVDGQLYHYVKMEKDG